MPINIKTSVFEGPLDLLIELIEKRKLLINDISLAQVADEYIASLESKDYLHAEETAEFVALAATLLLIKSRSLLPSLELTDDETHDIKELEYRLEVHKIIREAARELAASLSLPMLYDGRSPELDPLYIAEPSATKESLLAAVFRIIEEFPQMMELPKVALKKIISLEEMVQRLAERVSSALRLSFKEFSGMGRRQKPEVIIGFLALLELVKQGIISATQEESGDIRLEADAVSAPSYE